MPRDQTVWFAMIDGLEAGPMSRGEFALRMAADRVNEETFVWKEGMSEWLPAVKVRELAPMFHSKVKAKKKLVRPPPPPAAALAKSKPLAVLEVVEEEIPLELATPEVPPPAPTPAPVQVAPEVPQRPPAVIVPEAPPPDEDDDSTVAEMLPLGERVHQEEVAQELFTTGEHSRSGKTGAFAIDELKWAYARSQKEAPPQDAKAAALARAIKATAARPSEGALPALARHPVTPAHSRTPTAGLRPRSSPPQAGRQFRSPRAVVLMAGFGAGLLIVAASILAIWLLR